jgi:hypothetical protein
MSFCSYAKVDFLCEIIEIYFKSLHPHFLTHGRPDNNVNNNPFIDPTLEKLTLSRKDPKCLGMDSNL